MDKKVIAEKPGIPDVAIGEKVNFLRNPYSWPFPAKETEVKETHMSWVFLVNGYVFKLKKPVYYGLPDFRSIDARFKNCTEELRLNKRLAKDIYLEVVPLFVNEAGNPTFIKNGRICDWLVKMKRIPEADMLDFAIRNHTISEERVIPAARHLVQFYLNLEGISNGTEQFIKSTAGEIKEISSQLENPMYALPTDTIWGVRDHLLKFISENQVLLETRVKAGFIREVHGDLRPEHICIGPVPAVIDCLEFSRNLRIMDVVQELAYLDMECEMMGEQTAGKIFLQEWMNTADDHAPERLIIFYKLRKALLRVWLVARHTLEPEYRNDPKWLVKAHAYLACCGKLLNKTYP